MKCDDPSEPNQPQLWKECLRSTLCKDTHH